MDHARQHALDLRGGRAVPMRRNMVLVELRLPTCTFSNSTVSRLVFLWRLIVVPPLASCEYARPSRAALQPIHALSYRCGT